MALKTACDVYGTTKDIKKYRVMVGIVEENGEILEPWQLIVSKDMCARAYLRLLNKIDQGTTPPSKRKAE